MYNLNLIGVNAKNAQKLLRKIGTIEKNRALICAGKAIMDNKELILEANRKDIEAATAAGIKGSLIDRLTLNESRINELDKSLQEIHDLSDPVGEFINTKTLTNGLIVGQKRIPIGVIGIIYEARPNVTVEAFGLCLKTGNAVILRGGKEAINSNIAIVNIIQNALNDSGLPSHCIQLIQDTSRETAKDMMKMNGYIDVLIPRGGASLIKTVIENSTVPVIETGVGNCHIFVDESADLNMAVNILYNAKTQRPGVCNACETLIVHRNIAGAYLPEAYKKLKLADVEIRADETAYNILSSYSEDIKHATEDDWVTEFLDYIIAVKVVENIDEAIEHIAQYSTGHSEAIITENYSNSSRFLNEVDSAAVYVNASTRFTDGYQMGLGAEIGISTQKLHARGPMGLKELTTTKYVIYGNGQIRY